GLGEGREGDARAQAGDAPERALGQEGDEPEAGDRDRALGGAPRGGQGAVQETRGEEIDGEEALREHEEADLGAEAQIVQREEAEDRLAQVARVARPGAPQADCTEGCGEPTKMTSGGRRRKSSGPRSCTEKCTRDCGGIVRRRCRFMR